MQDDVAPTSSTLHYSGRMISSADLPVLPDMNECPPRLEAVGMSTTAPPIKASPSPVHPTTTDRGPSAQSGTGHRWCSPAQARASSGASVNVAPAPFRTEPSSASRPTRDGGASITDTTFFLSHREAAHIVLRLEEQPWPVEVWTSRNTMAYNSVSLWKPQKADFTFLGKPSKQRFCVGRMWLAWRCVRAINPSCCAASLAISSIFLSQNVCRLWQ